jgi:hypothetical protein
MTPATLADWTTPRPFAATGSARPDSDVDLLVVERTPHLEGEAKVASWWCHFAPLKPLRQPVDLIFSGSADATRHGQVLVVRP